MVTLSPFNSVFDRMVTLSRAMDEAMGSPANENGAAQQYWTPSIDAWETEQGFIVQLDLPGVTAEHVDITFDKNTLTVRGNRAPALRAPEKSELRVYFAERAHGTFTRTLRFPQYVEGDRISAAFANGVLTITVPKAEAAKPRKIAVGTPVEAARQG